MAKAYTLPASEEGHHAPPRTIMQGSVDDGFDGGYEERDVQFRPLFAWSAAILAMALGTMVIVWGYMAFMVDFMSKEEAALPPVMLQQRTPPQPRLLPNVIDEANRIGRGEPLQMPLEWGAEVRAVDTEAAAKLGLYSRDHGRPILPNGAVAEVMRSAGGAPYPSTPAIRPQITGTSHLLPSDSSGGLRLQNRQH